MMDVDTYHGEPLSDPGKLIRLTLRGHYVRWRLERALAGAPTTSTAPDPLGVPQRAVRD